jgi:asparagine synthase (glutamine-hydrolysing)
MSRSPRRRVIEAFQLLGALSSVRRAAEVPRGWDLGEPLSGGRRGRFSVISRGSARPIIFGAADHLRLEAGGRSERDGRTGMCGFAAYVGPGATARAGEVGRRADRLRHRGPDAAGYWGSSGAALAHRRLSIIDVAGGAQPLLAEDGRLALVCNGEIYNHRRLRAGLEGRHRFHTRSDSEVILHLYEEGGAACVEALDGMFAFVLTDGDHVLAARDPLGIKPLYVGRDGPGFWFASELKSVPPRCTELAELPPGSCMTEEGVARPWFTPGWLEPRRSGEPPDGRLLAERLTGAVSKRLMSDVPLGVFLSGGLDSSVVAALVRREIPVLHSFAVGLEGSPDLLAARRVAAHLRTVHHEYVYTPREAAGVLRDVVSHLESYDAALIRSAVPCYFVSRIASEYVKVVLTGEGSDEAFAGYRYFAAMTDPAALHRECARLLAGLHNMNLQRVDRMTMAHGLEGRVPFLDVDFLALAMALDPAEKIHRAGRPEKWLLRRAFEHLLPADIVWRTKQEFAQGCGSERVLTAHGEGAVTDADFSHASAWFPDDPPATKEAFLYRRLFEEMFPGEAPRRTVGRWRGAAPSNDERGE